MGILWKLSKVGIRVGLVVGAVKLSYDHDIWSLNTVKGSDLYNQIKKYIVPGTIVYADKLPSVEEVQVKVGTSWNNGVTKVFDSIETAPSSLNTVANRLINNK
ncbi:unnamed protein product [Auanema sp. JU1783]|nr:unnamed protein product [Auanema sp. JU1783]